MANHKSAIKRIRSNDKKRVLNRYHSKTMRNAIKKFRGLKDKSEAGTKLPGMVSLIDKMAKRRIIHRNKASNLKSKLTRLVAAL